LKGHSETISRTETEQEQQRCRRNAIWAYL